MGTTWILAGAQEPQKAAKEVIMLEASFTDDLLVWVVIDRQANQN